MRARIGLGAALTQCTQNPTLTVPQAFDVAFGRAPRP